RDVAVVPLPSAPLTPCIRLDLLGVLVAFFFFQAEDGIRDATVTGVQTCALPISFEVMEAFGAPVAYVSDGRNGGADRTLSAAAEIGRASCRERGEIAAAAGWVKTRGEGGSTVRPSVMPTMKYDYVDE